VLPLPQRWQVLAMPQSLLKRNTVQIGATKSASIVDMLPGVQVVTAICASNYDVGRVSWNDDVGRR